MLKRKQPVLDAYATDIQNGERSAHKLLSFLNLEILSCINGVNRESCNYCKLYIVRCIVSDNIFCVVNTKLVYKNCDLRRIRERIEENNLVFVCTEWKNL